MIWVLVFFMIKDLFLQPIAIEKSIKTIIGSNLIYLIFELHLVSFTGDKQGCISQINLVIFDFAFLIIEFGHIYFGLFFG